MKRERQFGKPQRRFTICDYIKKKKKKNAYMYKTRVWYVYICPGDTYVKDRAMNQSNNTQQGPPGA